jgi:hypothetical protein
MYGVVNHSKLSKKQENKALTYYFYLIRFNIMIVRFISTMLGMINNLIDNSSYGKKLNATLDEYDLHVMMIANKVMMQLATVQMTHNTTKKIEKPTSKQEDIVKIKESPGENTLPNIKDMNQLLSQINDESTSTSKEQLLSQLGDESTGPTKEQLDLVLGLGKQLGLSPNNMPNQKDMEQLLSQVTPFINKDAMPNKKELDALMINLGKKSIIAPK